MRPATPQHLRRTRKWWKEPSVADSFAKLKAPELLDGFRKHKGWTITKLAAKASNERLVESGKTVSRQMVSYLINGDLQSCEVDLAAALESVLDVPAHTIFDVLPKSLDTRDNDKPEAIAV